MKYFLLKCLTEVFLMSDILKTGQVSLFDSPSIFRHPPPRKVKTLKYVSLPEKSYQWVYFNLKIKPKKNKKKKPAQ